MNGEGLKGPESRVSGIASLSVVLPTISHRHFGAEHGPETRPCSPSEILPEPVSLLSVRLTAYMRPAPGPTPSTLQLQPVRM